MTVTDADVHVESGGLQGQGRRGGAGGAALDVVLGFRNFYPGTRTYALRELDSNRGEHTLNNLQLEKQSADQEAFVTRLIETWRQCR